MKDKLSLEKVIEKLDWWRKIAHIGGGCKDRDICEQAYEQIKSLLTPVPEEKLNEFVEKKVEEWGYFSPRQKIIVKGFMLQLLKEYDKEKESSDEK